MSNAVNPLKRKDKSRTEPPYLNKSVFLGSLELVALMLPHQGLELGGVLQLEVSHCKAQREGKRVQHHKAFTEGTKGGTGRE